VSYCVHGRFQWSQAASILSCRHSTFYLHAFRDPCISELALDTQLTGHFGDDFFTGYISRINSVKGLKDKMVGCHIR